MDARKAGALSVGSIAVTCLAVAGPFFAPSWWPLFAALGLIGIAGVVWALWLWFTPGKVHGGLFAPKYDWNMQQAFQYVRDKHFQGVFPEGPTDGPLLIFSNFRQRASDGDLTIWGRPSGPGDSVQYVFNAPPLVKIPPEHWREMDFDTVLYIFGDEPDRIREAKTHPDNGWNRNLPSPFWDLMVSSAELRRLWPPRAKKAP